MGKPYSLDLRERIIGFVEGGGSRREAADRFGVWLAIGNICDLFTPAECWNFFRHDGYVAEFT
jgi:hypothetical protein